MNRDEQDIERLELELQAINDEIMLLERSGEDYLYSEEYNDLDREAQEIENEIAYIYMCMENND